MLCRYTPIGKCFYSLLFRVSTVNMYPTRTCAQTNMHKCMHAAIMLLYCVYCVLLFNKRILPLYHCAFAFVYKCGKQPLHAINKPRFNNKTTLEVSTFGIFYFSLFDFQLGLLKSNRKAIVDFRGFRALLIKPLSPTDLL